MAKEVGYPLVVRPSYVLGGRAMEIVHGEDELRDYVDRAVSVSNDSPILLDRFLDLAVEVDVDAICDGEEVIVARHHGARRASRHPFRRLRLLAAAVQLERRDAADAERSSAPDGAGAQGQRHHEHAVRDSERRRSTCSKSTRAPRARFRSSRKPSANRSRRSPRRRWPASRSRSRVHDAGQAARISPSRSRCSRSSSSRTPTRSSGPR